MSNENSRWVVDGLYLKDDGTVVATHSGNKTIMMLKPMASKIPGTKGEETKFEHKFAVYEPDGEERIDLLHAHGIITDEEMELEAAQLPQANLKRLVSRLNARAEKMP